jgi:hypothetical protein
MSDGISALTLWVSAAGKHPRTQEHGATENVSCLNIERAKHLVFLHVFVPLMNYMSTKN